MKAYIYKDDLGKVIDETDIPEDMRELAETYHDSMLEAISDYDEAIMEKYLEGEEVSQEEIKAALRKACILAELVPVTCGSSFKNKGVQKLLDCVVEYMPSPLDVPPIKGVNPKTGEEDVRHADDDEPLAALAFKIMSDPFVGKLAFTRIYPAVMTAGSYIYNPTKGKRERVGRILRDARKSSQDVEKAYAGDIVGIVGLKRRLHRRYAVCGKPSDLFWNPWLFPEPVISVAIEPEKQKRVRTR
jgi:elongation factor G